MFKKIVTAILTVMVLTACGNTPVPTPVPTATMKVIYPSIVVQGRLGTLQIPGQYFKIYAGQRLKLDIVFTPKYNGDAEIPTQICTFPDGFVLTYAKLAAGTDHTGVCTGAIRFFYYADSGETEKFSVPIRIEVISTHFG